MKKQSLKIILTVIWLLAAGICYSCSHVPSHSTDSEWKLELSDDPEDTQEETTSDDRTESDPAVYMYAARFRIPACGNCVLETGFSGLLRWLGE